MTVQVNNSFSPYLPVNGGCPQGSLLGVIIFNTSVDVVEKVETSFLSEVTEGEINVGDFFDIADREFLRAYESSTSNTLTLIPGISIPVREAFSESGEFFVTGSDVMEQNESLGDSFESNGLPLVSFASSTPLHTYASRSIRYSVTDCSAWRSVCFDRIRIRIDADWPGSTN